MESPTLSKWRIEAISTDTVTGVDVETGDTQEWGREWLIRHLGTGIFSVELTDFDRVSVTEITGVGTSHTDDRDDDASPHVIVTVFGNNGQQFTRTYAATEPGNWESLTLVREDRHVQEFDEELRREFDAAVTEALEMEQQYH